MASRKKFSMKLVQVGSKWVLYNSNGKVVIITTTKRIAERMMQNDNSID
jgi:glucan-binding YG repeat protein